MNKNFSEYSWTQLIVSKGKWYLLSSLFSKGIQFFLLPFYTRLMTTEQIGRHSILMSSSAIVSVAVSLYLDSAFIKWFNQDTSKESRSEVLSTTLSIIFLWGLLVIGALSLIDPKILKLDATSIEWIAVLLYSLSFQINSFLIIVLRQNLESKLTTLSEVGNTIITSLLMVATFTLFNSSEFILLRFLIPFIGFTFSISFLLFVLRKHYVLRLSINKKMLREMLIFCLPLIPTVLSGWITGSMDKFIIAHKTTTTDVAYYTVAFQLAYAMYILQDAATQVLSPISVQGLLQDKTLTKKRIIKASISLQYILVFFNICLSLFSYELIRYLIGQKYLSAYTMISIIGLTYIISAQYRLFSPVIIIHSKNKYIAYGALLSAFVSVFINFTFMNYLGWQTAGWALIASTFVYALFIIVPAKKMENLTLPWKVWLKTTFIFMVFHSCTISINTKTSSHAAMFWRLAIFAIASYFLYNSFKADFKKSDN